MRFHVAVVGATGMVGQEMLTILAEREFPVSRVRAFASRKSMGQDVYFGDRRVKIEDLEQADFSDIDLALFAAGGDVAKRWAPRAAAQGAIVIDNSSAFRMDPDVPLVVPEVNADALAGVTKTGIVANPNCSTAQLMVALKPLHDAARIRRVVVATYQSVSGAGKDAAEELFSQTRAIFVNDPVEPVHFPKQIAFNLIPHIDVFLNDGATREEWKMREETKKILDPAIELIAFCVRVPVFVGHAEAVFVEFHDPITPGAARKLLREAPGILVVDKREPGGYVTPVECVGDFATYVSRIRRDPTVENGLVFWVVSDNLRKGAALNAVQIAESLVNRGLLKPRAEHESGD